MIAKITRGNRPGDIGAYLHGPGKANEHVYKRGGKDVPGGVVIASSIGAEGQTDPSRWAADLRAAISTRPGIRRPVWQASLRNTAQDRLLSDAEWAEAGQSFAEEMGFAEHPWVMVRHGADHVHVVVSRVSDEGEVWHGRNDRRAAQSACTRLEDRFGLEKAPRRSASPKKTVTAERENHQRQTAALGNKRAGEQQELKEARQSITLARKASFPGPAKTQKSSMSRSYPAADRGAQHSNQKHGIER